MVLRAVIAAAILTVGLEHVPALAFPVPLSTTDEVIVNVDFTGSVPAAPYGAITVTAFFDSFIGGQPLMVKLYGDLDGIDLQDSEAMSGFPLPNPLSFPVDSAAALGDGRFSLGFQLQPFEMLHDVNLTGVAVLAEKGTAGAVTLQASLAGTAVPEPTATILLCLGLAAVAVWRRAV